MKKDIINKMIEIGFKDIQEKNDFIFSKNENNLLIKMIYLPAIKTINVNHLEHDKDGHSYSYYLDLVHQDEDCKLEEYFKLRKEDLDISRRFKLN